MATKNKIQLIPGIHSVKEAVLKSRGSIFEIWFARGKTSSRVKEIIKLAERHNIHVFEKDSSILDNVLPGTNHQGIAALIESFEYTDMKELMESSRGTKGRSLLIAIDHITDEGNLGAIIRSAAFFGVNGIILPKDRSARISEGVIKRSSGGYAHVPVSLVVNLGRTIDMLDGAGFWIIGTSGTGKDSIYEFDWRGDILLVLGNEEKGVSPSILKRCHQTLKIPSSGNIEALNVSVATGVILSEITRQRSYKT
jgi:23S rRNA (guanosine2251-2'-O)-methyltransferase